MNKMLISLQKNNVATGVVILNKDYKNLPNVVTMKATISNSMLFSGKPNEPIFKTKVETMSKGSKQSFLLIYGIDELPQEEQRKYISLVKDRYFNGYTLPQNCTVVFTVKNEQALTKILPELYHFLVVAI